MDEASTAPALTDHRSAALRAAPPHLRKIAAHLAGVAYEPERFTVSAHDIAKFATAIGADDAIYVDEDAAAAAGMRGIVAPRGFHISLGTMRGRLLLRSDYAGDGLPAEEQLEDARLVVGGSNIEFFDEIYAGDEISVEQEVGAMQMRQGRSGPMLLVDLKREYRRGDGTCVVRERITRILR